MNNDIVQKIINFCSLIPKLSDAIINNQSLSFLDNIDILDQIASYEMIINGTYTIGYDIIIYEDLLVFLENNGLSNIKDGLISFESYRNNQVAQVEALRQSDDIIKSVLKDQFKSISTNKSKLLKFEVMGMIIENKDKELLQSWFKIAISIFLENCYTFNYLSYFISHGLTDQELENCQLRL